MPGLLARLLGRGSRDAPAEPVPPASGPPEWASREADLRRQLRTLEIAHALRTIGTEEYEDRRRGIERRLAEETEG